MATAALVVTLVVAVAHLSFMVLETFLWTKPGVRRIFGLSAEEAETTKLLAQNQGVYNGALAALLVWTALAGQPSALAGLLVFVIVVGVYGGITVKRSILLTQALPAAVALTLLALGT